MTVPPTRERQAVELLRECREYGYSLSIALKGRLDAFLATAAPGPWVPKVGDVVRYVGPSGHCKTEWVLTGMETREPYYGYWLGRELQPRSLAKGTLARDEIVYLRPATPQEREAAGLPATPAELRAAGLPGKDAAEPPRSDSCEIEPGLAADKRRPTRVRLVNGGTRHWYAPMEREVVRWEGDKPYILTKTGQQTGLYPGEWEPLAEPLAPARPTTPGAERDGAMLPVERAYLLAHARFVLAYDARDESDEGFGPSAEAEGEYERLEMALSEAARALLAKEVK